MKKPWSGSPREVRERWIEASDGAETERRGAGCLEVGGKSTHTPSLNTHTQAGRCWRFKGLLLVIYPCGFTK